MDIVSFSIQTKVILLSPVISMFEKVQQLQSFGLSLKYHCQSLLICHLES